MAKNATAGIAHRRPEGLGPIEGNPLKTLNMNKPTNEDDVTGTEASETSDPAVVSELVTSVVINSSDNVSWNSELEKFDISESNIISMQAKLSYIKEFFQNDMYWPISKITGKHNQVTDHNRDKMIQVIDEITNKILFLDKCKVKTGTHLEPAKEKLDKAIKDLDILAVEGLSKKRRFIIYDLSREIKASLETARLTLNEHMHDELSEDDQMRILRSPTNSPGVQNISYRRIDSHSSVVSVTDNTAMEVGSMEKLDGPSTSGTQKRHEPEPEIISLDNSAEKPKKTKLEEEPEENVGELNHLAHSELDYLKSMIENDSLSKRITVSMRKELTGSYNRICSIVRDITYKHAQLEGRYDELLKKINDNVAKPKNTQVIDEHAVAQPANEGTSYVSVTQRKSNVEPVRVSVQEGRPGKKTTNKQKLKGTKPKQTNAPIPKTAPNEVRQATREDTFQVVGRKNKNKIKTKTYIDLNTMRKPPAMPRFILKDSAGSGDYPKLWKSFWVVLRGKMKNPRLAVHRSRTKGPTILVPDNKDTEDILRGIELVSEIIPRKPRLILKGLDSSLSDEEVIQELLECNPELGLTDTDARDIRVAYHSGPRSGTVNDLVLEVSPEILRRIEGKKAYIGGIRSTLSLNHSVSQCFKCQKHGHTAKNCREEDQTCRNCAENHDSRTCQIKEYKCSNCKGKHKASSDSCPAKIAALKRLAKRTDFGQPLRVGTSDEVQQ